ncbi:MAG: DUF4917 family protein [Dehalococcoidia bacterium]
MQVIASNLGGASIRRLKADTIKILQWKDLADSYSDSLLLGNGASIAISPSFNYASLYDAASSHGFIDQQTKGLFDSFSIKDFEYVLRRLADTNHVNQILQISEDITASAYDSLKNALVQTVQTVHPEYGDVLPELEAISKFMTHFRTVVNLNYDLLVYWAMLRGNELLKATWFKDGFFYEQEDKALTFHSDYGFMYEPISSAKGATLVFYPHGNLVLAKGWVGKEEKISKDRSDCLLSEILSQWNMNHYTPLFISEGNTEQKHLAIGRSDYLNVVYNKVLPDVGDSLVIYGWAFGDQDAHILKALDRHQPARIAVSVHMHNDEWRDYCHHVKAAIDSCYRLKHCHLDFFDSESEEVWMKCTRFKHPPEENLSVRPASAIVIPKMAQS